MEKRKAYNLKWLLAVYNILQVATCCYIIYGFLSNEFSIIKFWKCQSVDYKSNRKANSLVIYSYQTFLLKLAELIETVFFVLRKKQNQVSKLHVYHHVSTAVLAWCVVKYAAGEHFNYYCHKKEFTSMKFQIILCSVWQAVWCYFQWLSTHSCTSSCTVITLLLYLALPCNENWKASKEISHSFKW